MRMLIPYMSDTRCMVLKQVGHQLMVIQRQLARDDIDEWERDILVSEWDLLSKVKHAQTPET